MFFLWKLGLLVFLKTFLVVKAADETDITRLRSTILSNYDPQTRPVQNNENTVNLRLHFLYNAIEFDDQRSLMTLHLLLSLTWKDEHVKWSPLNYNNLSEVTFAATELWKPDLNLINNYDSSNMDHFSNMPILGYYDSTMWWIPQTKFQVLCPTDYLLWPYDKQSCTFQVASWSHDSSEVNLTVPENFTWLVVAEEWQEHLTENREWKLIQSSVERINQTLYCCPVFEDLYVVITVEVQRRSNAHTAAVTVVALGIASATLISFWLSPYSNERLPLTLLAMMLNSIYLQFLYKAIPNNPQVPLAICFFRDSLIMVTFALAWTVAIRYVSKTKRNSAVPLPAFVEIFLRSFGAMICCLNPRPEVKRNDESNTEDGDGSKLVGHNSEFVQQDWEWFARLMDRAAFFGYLITYFFFIVAFL